MSVVPLSFRSALVVLGIAAGVSAGAASGAVAAPSGPASRATSIPSVQITRPTCTSALDDPQQRAAVFTVRASRGPVASAYGFRAELEERPAGGRWSRLTGAASPAGLGAFQSAADGAAAMVRRINVRGLRMGSAYRLKISFRWVTPSGKRRVTRRSAACTVRELRPNVGIARSQAWTPGTRGDQVVYRAQLRVQRMTGLADREVTVSVLQGSTVLGRVTPRPLVHGASVLIPGTLCRPGADVTYRIELSGPVVEESNAADNELTVPCDPRRAADRR